MIIPLGPDEMATATDEQVRQGYLDLGFDGPTADAYLYMLGRGPSAAPKDVPEAMMSVQTAKSLAEAVGHAELLAEVNKSIANNVAFVKLTVTDDTMVISSPEDVTVSWFHDADDRIPLVTLGKAADLTLTQTRRVVAVVNEVAARHSALHGVIKGEAPYIPGLGELVTDLTTALGEAGLAARPFEPRMVNEAKTDEPYDVAVSSLTVGVGPYRYDALIKPAPDNGIAKSVEEKRFTLAPMYIPGKYDAQGDWSDPDELQKALWNFQRGNKLIALQHKPGDGAKGEAVEMMVVPWEHTVPMFKADGSHEDVTFPAGTPWLGVIWNEEVWPMVKAGKVRGYSIGGRANLLNVELPEG